MTEWITQSQRRSSIDGARLSHSPRSLRRIHNIQNIQPYWIKSSTARYPSITSCHPAPQDVFSFLFARAPLVLSARVRVHDPASRKLTSHTTDDSRQRGVRLQNHKPHGGPARFGEYHRCVSPCPSFLRSNPSFSLSNHPSFQPTHSIPLHSSC